MFQEKGEIIIEKEGHDEDEMMMALDAGAEDFNVNKSITKYVREGNTPLYLFKAYFFSPLPRENTFPSI